MTNYIYVLETSGDFGYERDHYLKEEVAIEDKKRLEKLIKKNNPYFIVEESNELLTVYTEDGVQVYKIEIFEVPLIDK